MNQTLFGIRTLLCQTFLSIWSLQGLRVQRYQCLRGGVWRESVRPAVKTSVGILQPQHHLSIPRSCWGQVGVCAQSHSAEG